MAFHEKEIKDVNLNPFTTYSKDWVLITAKRGNQVNTMTAAWGGFGHVWNHNVATVYIRPQRYTKEFVDAGETFSIAVFPEEYREKLIYFGRTSGRDEDKITKAGLTVEYYDGTPYFAEAKQVFIVKKLYAQELKEENFIDTSVVDNVYPEKDFHTLYIGSVQQFFVSDDQ